MQVIIAIGVNIKDNKLAIIAVPKIILFDLLKDVCNNLNYETDSFIKHNQLLSEHTIKNEISQLLFKYKHGNNSDEHGKQ